MKIISRKFLDKPTPTCHASTIAFHRNTPVFAWFGGNREGLPDSSIYVQYQGEIKTLGKERQVAHWNPVLFTIKDELFLSYKIGEFCDRWQSYIINITDIENIDDLDKVEKQIIPAGFNFCVKTKPLIDGNDIYCGSSVETRWDWTSYIEYFVYHQGEFKWPERDIPLAVKEKKSYVYDHPVYGRAKFMSLGIIQPTLWKDKKGDINAFFRSSRGLDKIYHSRYFSDYSEDIPKWSTPQPTKFDNPNSSVDVVYMDNRLFLVHNPSTTVRNPLVIKELDDEFRVVDEIEVTKEVKATEKTYSKELSYPFMVGYKGKLHLTYTYGRSFIEWVMVNI